MPQNNSDLQSFILWLKDNAYLHIGVIIAFAISYLSATKKEIESGEKNKSKLIDSSLCAILSIPYYLAVTEVMNYFNYESTGVLAVVIGAFLGSLGADKAKAILVKIIDTLFSLIGNK